ncbi:nicotinamide N-methyltransferase-like [Eleutherodactylus coqui]|uniref:nicotinamide N-methyltransferase-like n=1 Tax=Eleutherodactylus coqui TaxID=57060 RepID=UPI0034620AF5
MKAHFKPLAAKRGILSYKRMDAPNSKQCHEKIDRSKPKVYHKDGMNTRSFLQTYCDRDTVFGEDNVKFIIKKIHDALAAGHFKGKTAYDFSVGSIIYQLYTVSDCYPEITILKLNDTCIMELNKWLAMRTGAFDWSHTHDYVKGLHCTSHQEDLNKEENLKTCIKRILKFDLQKANITDPEVLEQADCIIIMWLLEVVCQDQNDYINNFQSMAKFLKPGGLLIFIGCLNTSYYKVGEDRYHIFTYDECFLRKNLANEGFKIKTCEVLDSKIQSDLTDYKQIIVVTAIKECRMSKLP